tara:strand:+ start:3016 stop:3249 length:234 start_codon:yes stop_codon:yes gene_type:complete
MITSFLKKLIKYYVDKFVHWLRMKKFNLELDNQIKKFHDSYWREVAKQKPQVIEKGTFGEDDWSISIGDIKDGNTKN